MQFTSLANSKLHFVGNKAKGRISKRVFQDNKARQIFRKTNISYPLVPGTHFEIRPFALLPKNSYFMKSLSNL